MTEMKRLTRPALLAVMLAAALWVLPQPTFAATLGASPAAQAGEGDRVAQEAAARLDKKQYRDVKVQVENGVATLTGTVSLFEYKADAEKRLHRVKGITAVRNLIEVAGASVPDAELKAKLA